MIGKLRGLVDSQAEGHVILDVQGVGYLVHCSGRTLSALPGRGEEMTLWIETLVREDLIQLLGFADQGEQDWFRLLSTVQGVGARMALAILSVLPPEELVQAIAAQDKKMLTRANGVGPKLAQRIVTELKDKAAKMSFGGGLSASSDGAVSSSGGTAAAGAAPSGAEDAIAALEALGYRRTEAFTAVMEAARKLEGAANTEDLVKGGLRELAS
ncbi:Holliday junction branch migration protein RuvA [Rhodovibrionaceae bacterium A322]